MSANVIAKVDPKVSPSEKKRFEDFSGRKQASRLPLFSFSSFSRRRHRHRQRRYIVAIVVVVDSFRRYRRHLRHRRRILSSSSS